MTTKTAIDKDYEVQRRCEAAGLDVTRDQARELRRIELTLHRWHEYECGVDGGMGSTLAIDRDEETGKPRMYRHGYRGTISWPTPDREKGALKRLAALCEEIGCHYYVQGDPRGAALYVDSKPISATAYHSGACCGV